MKKTIVVSAINLRSGGTLSILNDCLEYLDIALSHNYKIIALVHDKALLKKTQNIKYIEFPKSVKSYLYRIYYEYIYFNKLSKQLKPYLWLSLHDISPNVKADIKAVYCHNPSPFYRVSFKEFLLDPKFALFTWFYKYLYKINISKNNYVIVQQEWIRDKFQKMYNIKQCIVTHPIINIDLYEKLKKSTQNETFMFFYPSFPRVFKNFEVVCQAAQELSKWGMDNFELVITIDGTENRYSKTIYKKYKDCKNIKFIGLQTREKVFELYAKSNCLVFPSKLETWGLPISEYKKFGKPMLVADLEYAHETVGEYNKVVFFNPNDYHDLAIKMKKIINKELIFENHSIKQIKQPFAKSWDELFALLLRDNK